MSKVVVIGGGAAGMMAAISAAQMGHQVVLYEKNEKLGKKIYITGKGRCNVTNACDVEKLLQAVNSNSKFLCSAFYGFDSGQAMAFFEENGCKLKVERGERVFPVSDHASDVIFALQRCMKNLGVEVNLHTEVTEVCVHKVDEAGGNQDAAQTKEKAKGKGKTEGKVYGVKLKKEGFVEADSVIVATGGLSYPTTGSTGDGYRFAGEMGLEVVERRPSLVPLNTAEKWCHELMGLSLKNVEVCLSKDGKEIYRDFGEMLFTHFGVSGPLILSASCQYVQKAWKEKAQLTIDLKPALDEEQLDKRLLREFEENKNKQFKNAVSGLFPSKLTPVMIALSGIEPEKKVNEITKQERKEFVALIKKLPLTITGARDYNEAIITKGGVSVKEINPSTMESKKIKGLYFAGEVLDLDAVTGGFNLQIAWATGYLAGSSVEWE